MTFINKGARKMASKIVITDAGLAEVINATHTGTSSVALTEVGLGTGK